MARKAAMVISGGDGDGFLAKILGEGIRIDFHVGLGYSSKQGVHFEGGIDGASELVITIPIKAKLFGVITFENVQLGIKPNTEPPGVALRLGGTIITELGPLVATVENMGLELVIGFPASGGNAGPMDLQFGFKPPSGVGLSIDAKAVKGGGYLYIGDHRYAGVLQIVILSKISLTAIGIITTKMPDGSDGFGLFILISIEFDPGIQLSMGFSLTGVGGLLGLNRTMNADALRAGARNGTISNILFPKDILANAPEVIASIEGFFPLERGRFVFGPVVKIAWGSPAIVTIEIGLIIEVPSPVRIALPGVVRMALPDPESAILELNISFIGIIDFGEKYISIDASIFDSRILIFTLEGDMAFRLSWGDNPYFLYSMGGFHPAFQPPQSLGLSDMRRLSICIFNEPNLRLKFATYFALTSNTLQMGAGIEFYAGFAGFVVDARAGFDALFYFDPFHMDVALYLIAMLRAGDLDLLAMSLTARLTGPTPWTIVGEASFTLFGNSCSFLVEKTFGEEIDTTMPTVEVGSLLIDGLSDNANWIATASGHTTDDGDGVTLRSLADVSAANPDDIIVHPGGRLRIAQEALPLERTIELLGAETVSGPSWFEITSVDLIEGAVATPLDHEDTQARFAPAQYFEMTQTEKLAAPSFEAMNAGVQMSTTSSALRAGGHRMRTLSVEALWIDQEPPPSRLTVTTGDTLDPVEQERTDP